MSTTRSATCLDLEHILAPIDPESFFRETWEKKSLLVERDDEKHYDGLLSLRDVDQMIAFSRPKFTDQSAFRAAAPPRSTYVRGLLADQPPLPAQTNPGIAELRQVYDQGKSVVMMGVQQRWPAVAELCRNLEVLFHCPVHANMYLTPAGSQGFSAHYDPHEVFILQLEGIKQWRLYDRIELLPLASDKVVPPAPPLGAAREVCLKPGDLLYIPRGHVHDAYTADSFSLHLTVGINVYRWADLLHHALACASRKESRFRESIPGGALPGGIVNGGIVNGGIVNGGIVNGGIVNGGIVNGGIVSGGNAGLKQQFQHLLALLSDSAHGDQLFDQAAGSLADQFYGQLPMLPGTQFSSQVDLEQVGLDTVLEKHRHAICRILENDEGVAIAFPGNRVAGPHRIASALRFIADTVCFAVRELPDELNDQGKVVLARRLIREGLLTLAMPSPTARPADEQLAKESLDPETAPAGSDVRPGAPGRMSERPVPGPARQVHQREVVES